ncbi:MAG: Uma2 family endonuclease [Geminicoccaceae bacterium]
MQDRPTSHCFDVDAYCRMAEIGIFTREDRLELIDGIVFDMTPVSDVHAAATDSLVELVSHAAGRLAQLRVQGPLRLDAGTQVQPDLLLLRRRADRYRHTAATAADVLLLVEVADSSLAYDQGAKLALYARHGVPEVWIVDLASQAVEVCRSPGPQGYAERQRLDAGTIHPTLVPELAVDLGTLFQ